MAGAAPVTVLTAGSGATTTENATMSESLAKARMRACKEWPFATHAIMSLIPVRRNGLGTLSVDMNYRLYFDETVIRGRSDDENVFSLLHEVSHLLLRHHKRGKRVVSTHDKQAWDLWNTAADCAVNSLLRAEGITIPPNRAGIPSKYGLPWGQAAEAYYRELTRKQDEENQESQPETQNSDDTQPESADSTDETPGNSSEPEDSPQSPEKSDCDDDESGSPDSGPDAGDASGAFLGDEDAAQGDPVDENGD
jgi:predicted metal-dependent peptidase